MRTVFERPDEILYDSVAERTDAVARLVASVNECPHAEVVTSCKALIDNVVKSLETTETAPQRGLRAVK
jgi:hypothetical protein